MKTVEGSHQTTESKTEGSQPRCQPRPMVVFSQIIKPQTGQNLVKDQIACQCKLKRQSRKKNPAWGIKKRRLQQSHLGGARKKEMIPKGQFTPPEGLLHEMQLGVIIVVDISEIQGFAPKEHRCIEGQAQQEQTAQK